MIRRRILVGILILLGGYVALRSFQDVLPPRVREPFVAVDTHVQVLLGRVAKRQPSLSEHRAHASSAPAHAVPREKSAAPARVRYNSVNADATSATPARPLSPNAVTLYLANGGVITGELVSESPEHITLHWESGDVTFQRSEITRLVKGKQDTDADNLTMPWEAHR